MLKYFLNLLLGLVAVIVFSTVVVAENDPNVKGGTLLAHKGYVCTASEYITDVALTKGDPFLMCPPQHAFFGLHSAYTNSNASKVLVLGNCCRLPFDDVLSSEHKIVQTRCPDDYVVTGINGNYGWPDRVKPFRCTRINTKKYSLAPATTGVRWGYSASSAFPWQERKFIRRDEIPLAIRYGISRVGILHFSSSGCIGEPPGSLFVGRVGSRCRATLWQELRYRKITEIGDDSKSVVMFPDCALPPDIFSKEASCVEQGSSKGVK